MRQGLAGLAVVAAALFLVVSRTDAIETDPLWTIICNAGHDATPVQRAALASTASLLPMAPCSAAPTTFHTLPSVGGKGDANVTLAVGFDAATLRLCFVNRTVPEAPVIRVPAGRRLTVNMVNTLRNSTPGHTHNCAIGTYIDGAPCAIKPQFREQPGPDGAFYPIAANLPHLADGTTNLHVHGLAVSPLPCHDEVLQSVVYPADWGGTVPSLLPCQTTPYQLTYSYDIPADHPAGLNWYHTHRHGSAEPETMMGLAGAIVIEDGDDARREALGVTDQVLVVRDQTVEHAMGDRPPAPMIHNNAALAGRHDAARRAAAQAAIDPRIDRVNEVTCGPNDPDVGGPEATRLLLNSAPVPENDDGSFPPDSQLLTTTMAPGQRQLWRILNASADTYISPRLVLNQGGVLTTPDLEVVARDGVRLADAQGRPHIARFDVAAEPLLLAPGNRLEIIVHAPPQGASLYLESAQVHPGCAGDGDPGRRLLLVTSAGAPVAAGAADDSDLVARGPARGVSLPLDGVASVRRTFAFSEYPRAFTVAKTVWPDGSPQPGQFDPDEPDFFLTQTAASDGQGQPVRIVPFNGHNLAAQVVVHLHGADSVTEKWTLNNNTLEVHAFHIHQVHFRDVTANNGKPDDEPVLDTLNVPAAANVDGVPGEPGSRAILMTFTKDQIGEFVYHCHILEHEDNGMMGKIQVVAD